MVVAARGESAIEVQRLALEASEVWLMRASKGRKFTTGNRTWTSSRESADGRAVTIEIPSDRGAQKMTVRKEPLVLVPSPEPTPRSAP